MASILVLAIGVAISAALFGSMAIQSMAPLNDVVISPLEEKCQQIADEGYKIHALYPNSNPEELPERDMNRMLYLDNIWMKECVSALPHETILRIANNVERDFSNGE